jgi:hypothetical protein
LVAQVGKLFERVIDMAKDTQPIEIKTRVQNTVQTHNAVSVAAGATSTSAWVDSSGFNEVAITLLNDAATSNKLDIEWSNDGTNVQGLESVLVGSTESKRVANTSIKSRYFRTLVTNSDTVAHTLSAWSYLKA